MVAPLELKLKLCGANGKGGPGGGRGARPNCMHAAFAMSLMLKFCLGTVCAPVAAHTSAARARPRWQQYQRCEHWGGIDVSTLA